MVNFVVSVFTNPYVAFNLSKMANGIVIRNDIFHTSFVYNVASIRFNDVEDPEKDYA